jgi:NAD(P)-dependent dehydrogenase (short-subunit alcohol dehydrogenase family)
VAAEGRFDGVTALVTGGASGIGEAISRLVVAEGGTVVIADVQDEAGELLAKELGDAAAFHHTDVTVEDDLRAAVDTAVKLFGGLGVLCNNAGLVGADRPIEDTTVEDYDLVMNVLVRGSVLGTKHGARAMIAGGRGGSIVNTSSVAGITGGLGPHLYTVAKHAIIGLTRTTATQLAAHGIRVNAVAPGGIPTPMAARMITGDPANVAAVSERIAAKSPLGRSSTPLDVAEAVAYLSSPAGSYVTGQTLVIDAGATIGAPNRRTP